MSQAGSATLNATLTLLVFQFVSRFFSFGMNQVLLRASSPLAVGTAMSLDLIKDTICFLTKDPLRGALLRRRTEPKPTAATIQQINQTSLLPALAAPLAPLIFYSLRSFFGSSAAAAARPPHLNATIALYALATVFELLAEPAYLTLHRAWETKTTSRVRVEALAVAARAVADLVTVKVVGASVVGTLGFGVGQLAYSLVHFVGTTYLAGIPSLSFSRPVTRDKAGKVIRREARLDGEVVSLARELTGQGVLKQLLTESDKIVVSRISKVEDQGGYAVALNYGSLVARLVFQPIEESSRLSFSSQLATPTPATLLATANHLSALLLLHTHLSLAFFFLAPYYTSTLLYHLLGPRWSAQLSSAPLILGTYCRYLPFLAINGITEAFFQSTAGPTWLRRGNWALALSSVAFLGGVAGGVRMGWAERGMVYANCVGMAVRIAFCSVFIRSYYKDTMDKVGVKQKQREEVWEALSWRTWAPKVGTIVVVLLGSRAVAWSEHTAEWRSLRGLGEHAAVGAVVGVACLGTIYWHERAALRNLVRVVRKRKVD